MRRHLLLIGILPLLLDGCGSMNPVSWLAPDEVTDPPAELVEMDNRIRVNRIWSSSLGSGSEESLVKLFPRVYQGRIYVANQKGEVEVLDAATGKRVWRVETGLEITGGPGTSQDLVLLGTGNAELVALNIETGEEKWRTRVSSEILSIPKSGLGVAVVHTADGKLFAFDLLDGRQLWIYEVSIPVLTLHGNSSPVVSGSKVINGFASGKLAALDITSGEVLWEASVTVPSGRSELQRMVDIDGDPLIVGGIVYVATYHGDMAAVSEDSGVVFWRKKLSAYAGTAADWRSLYVADAQGQVWAIDPDNGVALWKNKDLLNRRLSVPAVLSDYVVVGDFEGYLHWLSTEDGKLAARVRLGDGPVIAPVVVDGTLYAYAAGGELAAFSLADPYRNESDSSGEGEYPGEPVSFGEPDDSDAIEKRYDDSEPALFDSFLPPGSKEAP